MRATRREIMVGAVAVATSGGARAQADPGLIEVRAAKAATTGALRFAGQTWPCALGRAGIAIDKREGDGATPAGRFALRRVFYRPDRGLAPLTELPITALTPNDGWCDAPGEAAYNRLVRLPFVASHETLWREDHLYDLMAVIGYNDAPTKPGAGSAIFLHVAAQGPGGLESTAGCVALPIANLRALLAVAAPDVEIDIALL